MLQIHTLGSLQIAVDGNRLTTLKNRKAQALLVYLACQRGQLFSRDHLQTLLWSDTPALKARTSLRQTLYKLQSAIPNDMLLLDNLQIGLDPAAACWLDLDHVAVDETLYRGEFLQGFSLRGAALWDEWLFVQRESVTATLVAQWEQSAETHTHDPATAIRYWQRVIELNSWREHPHRRLIELFLQNNDRAAAIAQYELLAKLLQEELGVEPSAETQALYARSLEDATPRSNLPHPQTLTPFVGRSAEIATLSERLRQPTTRLLTLQGLGGSGKTRLAIAVARTLQTHFADGVFFVNLTDSDPALFAATIAATIDIEGDVSEERLLTYLRSRKLLLVLDNFEQVVASNAVIDFVQRILRETVDVTLLVTSRERLRLQMEQLVTLTGFAQSADAVTLFVTRAQQISELFQHGVEESADIRQICQLVSGLPLAIELAAALTRFLATAEIAAEIERDLAILQANERDIPARQHSMMVVLRSAWERLPSVEQFALAKLSVFQGGFTRIAAAAIADTQLAVLARLVDASLVQRQPDHRFALHPLVRQFATQQLQNRAAIYDKHARWFAEQPTLYKEQAACNRFMLTEKENYQQAWLWLAEERETTWLKQMINSIHHSLMQTNQYTYAHALYEPLIALLETEPERTESEDALLADLYSRLTTVLLYLNRPNQASVATEKAIRLANQLENAAEIALAYSTLGELQRRRGRLSDAMSSFQLALPLYEEVGHQGHYARVLNQVGLTEIERGDIPAAIAAFTAALTIVREVRKDENGQAYLLYNLALTDQFAGQFLQAQTRFERSLGLFDKLQNQSMQASCAIGLANVARLTGKLGQAQGYLASAEIHLTHSIRPDHHALYHRAVGLLAMAQADLTIASDKLTHAHNLASVNGYAILAFRILGEMIEVALLAGDLGRAQGLLTQGEGAVGGFSADINQHPFRLNQATYLLKTDQHTEAKPLLQQLETYRHQLSWHDQQRLMTLQTTYERLT